MEKPTIAKPGSINSETKLSNIRTTKCLTNGSIDVAAKEVGGKAKDVSLKIAGHKTKLYKTAKNRFLQYIASSLPNLTAEV